MKTKTIVIGTRDSELALWQAEFVRHKLKAIGYDATLLKVKSTGDLILDKPLYEMGITGIFTKTLDIALLDGTIDIAVHSMKDVPTLLPKGIVQGAVLERADSQDVLLYKDGLSFLENEGTVATGSLRRKAQWLHKYTKHNIKNIRGNVNTRLQKLSESEWNGAIFAKAGLDRINLLPAEYLTLDWMIPAPAQGAMVVVTLAKNEYCKAAISVLNHIPTQICTAVERQFLSTLEGGCTAPIGALAVVNNSTIDFKGVLFSLDGKEKIMVSKSVLIEEADSLGKECAEEVLENGGRSLMAQIKKEILK